MPSLRALRSGIAVAAAMACAACLPAETAPRTAPEAEAPRPIAPRPSTSLLLENYGYRPKANNIGLRAGYTSATVHFIDHDHILLTYSARSLMKRSAEQREGDDDHTVRAVVIHLPDGKAIHETEWRMHDRAPYIWPLAEGRFLLRERGDLFSLDPLGKSDPEHLGRRLMLHSEDDLQALEFSPSRDLLLVERSPAAKIGDDPQEKPDKTVSVDFYRMQYEPDGRVAVSNRGRARARDAFSAAFTSEGILQSVKEDRTHWGFDFRPYGGKPIELAGFTSTCRPRAIFVSDAEFFAFGCRGGEDRRLMGGFNLLAEAQWVFTTDDAPLWLAVETAPTAGRFAMRNTLTNLPAIDADRLGGEDIRQQEVRVYGGRNGDELLRVSVAPAQRPAGNFALSPDGLRLAVLDEAEVKVYELPPIPEADRKLQEREAKVVNGLRASGEKNVAEALSEPVSTTP